jgi:hypothetical protein
MFRPFLILISHQEIPTANHLWIDKDNTEPLKFPEMLSPRDRA